MSFDIFTYEVPSGFYGYVQRSLKSKSASPKIFEALRSCDIDHNDVGLAYYAGIKNAGWNMRALDFTIEGPEQLVDLLEANELILKEAFDVSLRPNKSGYQVRDIFFFVSNETNVIPSSDGIRLQETLNSANQILDKILSWGEKFCNNPIYSNDLSENGFNDALRDFLTSIESLYVMDQTRHGLSPNGKDAGSVDLLVSKSNKEVALIEGLKLSSVNKGYIDSHIKKAVGPYNPLGTPVFLLCYVSVEDFGRFWSKCFEYLDGYEFPLDVKSSLIERPRVNASTRVASMMLSRDGYDFPLYVIAFKLLK